MKKQDIILIYHEKSYTHDYILGFEYKKAVVACGIKLTAELIDLLTCEGTGSTKNGGCQSVRFRPNTKQKELIMANAFNVDTLMSVEQFEQLAQATTAKRVNRGDTFEEVVASYYNGQRPAQRNLKWTEGGDVVIDGIHYQCKYNKATWTDEKTVLRG